MNAYDKAISLLSIREHTARELERKLLDKGFSKDEVQDAIARVVEQGFLSEMRFAESYIRSRLRKNPEGKALLRLRLMDKGSPRDIAESAILSFWEEGLYLKPLKEQYEKLSGKHGHEKAVNRLLQKGFSHSEIDDAINSF